MYFFRFDVHTSEKDYIDYNLFWTLQSPYGRKQIRDVRIFLAFLAFAGVLFPYSAAILRLRHFWAPFRI